MAETSPSPRLAPAPGPRESLDEPDTAPEPLWREALGDRLRQRRHSRGETLTETARRAGLSPQYLSEVERGIKEPSSEMIAAMAGALGVTLFDLTLEVARDLSVVRPAPVHASARTAYALAA